jgi:hypothetical protein
MAPLGQQDDIIRYVIVWLIILFERKRRPRNRNVKNCFSDNYSDSSCFTGLDD